MQALINYKYFNVVNIVCSGVNRDLGSRKRQALSVKDQDRVSVGVVILCRSENYGWCSNRRIISKCQRECAIVRVEADHGRCALNSLGVGSCKGFDLAGLQSAIVLVDTF